MGPIIGMSPDKKAESPGAQGVCGAGTLPEAESASSPMATSLDQIGRAGVLSVVAGESEDDELTNLNWLHENLLQNFTLGGEPQPTNSPLFDIEGGGGSPHSNTTSSTSSVSPGSVRDPYKSKPPFSFSLLIYMAIEQSPSKSLPVKDIYGWILKHFPYFSSAPTGWKNSVRHNLSLNKCFRKVERSIGKTNGKGSLWCVHPEFRPMLMQALKKQHFPNAHVFCTPPASPPSASSPPHHLFTSEQGCALKECDFDAATAMMLLKSASEQNIDSYPDDQEGPIDLSRRDLVVVSRDPKQDHNYSSTPVPPCPRQMPLSQPVNFSLALHHDQEREGRAQWPHSPLQDPYLGKRSRRDCRPDVDEELKEAAGSLLHLAGIRTSLVASRRKSRKLSRK
ncbi:forkhead box protein N2-like isoform X1 [Carassius auratus]|uniref:Forkhead box protein N2-like isoform X1 n=1 Tax=Carassius auratus TaxID=7957 RepID=A0A6P6L1M8_CARAU|nr:forkhead box protein N2-like isoform X1 [Carassius auratus]XP_026078448.1 forkhead box protein N2-like isoform X1 [Carassius auratus]